MGKVMRHTLGASLNIRHNLSSSKGPKPLQLKLLTTYIPKTSAFTRSEERFSRNAETDLVCRLLLEKKKSKNREVAPVVELIWQRLLFRRHVIADVCRVPLAAHDA